MKSEVRAALERSIAKWQGIADGTRYVSTGSEDCALCQVSKDDCSDCPVMEKTGKKCCKGTPWGAFSLWVLQTNDPIYLKPHHKKGRRLAQAEADFLKSLLPGESK